jgi:hypothetical protein
MLIKVVWLAIPVVIGLWLLATSLTDRRDWRLLLAIRRARLEIREISRKRTPDTDVFSDQGTTAINPRYLSFSIRTASDNEPDLLSKDPELYQQFSGALRRAGYPQKTVPFVHFGVESQKTVDRDYRRSWNERRQMP